MKPLIFKPWIPENFGTGKYGKLLIIGESHYIYPKSDAETTKNDDDLIHDDISGITKDVIQMFVDRQVDVNFYRNLGLAFNPDNRYELWENAAFSNAIQIPFSDPSEQPKAKHIETVIPAFWTILNEVKPSRIIICSQRMWTSWMPDYDERGKGVSDLREGDCESTIWKYNYEGGECFAIGINHPSSFFSYPAWGKFIHKFLSSY